MRDSDKIILQGRIYPSILSCVANRYRIIIGIFAFYAFLITHLDNSFIQNYFCGIIVASSIIFFLIALHNLYNYCENAKDKKDHGDGRRNSKKMEVAFFVFILIVLSLIIWFSISNKSEIFSGISGEKNYTSDVGENRDCTK